jgi:hypothetical protein
MKCIMLALHQETQPHIQTDDTQIYRLTAHEVQNYMNNYLHAYLLNKQIMAKRWR